jgi:hypothetical protein
VAAAWSIGPGGKRWWQFLDHLDVQTKDRGIRSTIDGLAYLVAASHARLPVGRRDALQGLQADPVKILSRKLSASAPGRTHSLDQGSWSSLPTTMLTIRCAG